MLKKNQLLIPAGQNIYQVAERLGVPASQLAAEEKLKKLDTPLKVDRYIDLPEGFLAARQRAERQAKNAPHITRSSKQEGMNSYLALEMERQRHAIAEAKRRQRNQDPSKEKNNPKELQELQIKAWSSYFCYHYRGNEMAFDLATELIKESTSHQMRGEMFALRSLCHCQRAILFGQNKTTARLQAISDAKSAIAASPKSGDAHLALGLALLIDGDANSHQEGNEEIDYAIELNPKNSHVWGQLAFILTLQASININSNTTVDYSEAIQALAIAQELGGEPRLLNTITSLLLATSTIQHTSTTDLKKMSLDTESDLVQQWEALTEDNLDLHLAHAYLFCALKNKSKINGPKTKPPKTRPSKSSDPKKEWDKEWGKYCDKIDTKEERLWLQKIVEGDWAALNQAFTKAPQTHGQQVVLKDVQT